MIATQTASASGGTVVLLMSLGLSLLCAVVGYSIGQRKGRGPQGLVLGFLLSILGLLVIWLWPAKRPAVPSLGTPSHAGGPRQPGPPLPMGLPRSPTAHPGVAPLRGSYTPPPAPRGPPTAPPRAVPPPQIPPRAGPPLR